jgi:hypothetical protein
MKAHSTRPSWLALVAAHTHTRAPNYGAAPRTPLEYLPESYHN